MCYAPHTNTDVQHQLRCGLVPTPDPMLLGSFRFDNAKGALFEYAERRWHTDDFAPTACHILYTIDGPRLCRVLKTVAHVVVGENADGQPIWENWPIACHRVYPTEWVKC